MTQEEFKQELQNIEELLNTPIVERPKYKAFYEQVKQIANNVPECLELGYTKELRQAEVWMANKSTLQRIRDEETIEYLNTAKERTNLLFKKYIDYLYSNK